MPDVAGWGSYDRWNEAIVGELFAGQYGSRPVYLDLEDETLSRVADRAGAPGGSDPARGLIEAVRPTVDLEGDQPVLARHAHRLVTWRRGDRSSPPPVIALLGYFSLVAERMCAEGEFAASNYYGRFLSMLGGRARDEEARTRIAHAFADHASSFWGSLNEWLEAQPDVRGIPTAYAFDHRAYVGLALSQALVRDADRRALHRLFEVAGLRLGQTVAVDDMTRILEAWLPDAPISLGLKRLAERPAVLARVAEIACVELAAGSLEPGAPAPSDARIALTASVRRLPRRRLHLGAAVSPPEEIDELTPGPACDSAGRAALGDATAVRLGRPEPDGWRPIVTPMGMADLLLSRFELSGEGFVARRQPRPVVVLAREGASDVYREVDRIRLTTEHMLLAVASSRERLEVELGKVARPGFEVHESFSGLPREWVLYEGVEVVAVSDTVAADLACLVPLAWTEISLGGGMKLPGKATWHARAAPELKATAASGRSVAVMIRDSEGEVRDELGSFEDSLIADVDELELEDGNYQVELWDERDDRVLSTAALSLRSADSAVGGTEGGHERSPLDGPLWPLSCEEGSEGEGELGAEGPDDVEAGDEEGGETEGAAPTVAVPGCYLTGAHYIVLPESGREERRPRRGELIGGSCKYCGLEKRFPARPRRGGARAVARPPGPPMLPPRSQAQPLDYDLLLDALCFIGAGRANGIRALVDGFEAEPWAAVEALRTLSALGHLDVALDRSLRPASWRLAPATIVLGAEDAFLAGYRSETMVYELGRRTELRCESQPEAPSRVVLPGLERSSAEHLADAVGFGLSVRESPARSLADALPSLPALRAALPALAATPSYSAIEKLEGNSWRPTESVADDGGYRTKGMPRTIWHRWGSDLRLAEARLVKWLVASPHELMTIGEEDTVVCRLGAKPPWLYERALVMASGLAPEPGHGYTVVYRGVPRTVAATLLGSMTEERGFARA